MNIFLTGATGFVGRNFLLRAIGDDSIGRIACSVRSGGKLAGQLAAEGIGGIPEKLEIIDGSHSGWGFGRAGFAPDVCIHLAGVLFARSEEEYFEGNEGGARKLVAELPPGCPLVAVSSQSAIGPTPSGVAELDESHPPSPLSFYGKSKLAMERFLTASPSAERVFILRPPVILGPRDTATEPLFQMARGPFLFKPCSKDKVLSWIAVTDFVDALFVLLRRVAGGTAPPGGLWNVANRQTITDTELLLAASQAVGGKGRLVRVPGRVLRVAVRLSKTIPAIGRAVPSLMPDRALELFEDRWVISPRKFERDFSWSAGMSLNETLSLAWRASATRASV